MSDYLNREKLESFLSTQEILMLQEVHNEVQKSFEPELRSMILELPYVQAEERQKWLAAILELGREYADPERSLIINLASHEEAAFDKAALMDTKSMSEALSQLPNILEEHKLIILAAAQSGGEISFEEVQIKLLTELLEIGEGEELRKYLQKLIDENS